MIRTSVASYGAEKRMEERPMITIIRTVAIAPGKMGDALAFANQIAKYFKEKYARTVEVLMPVGGNPARIAWLSNYESLAQWEAFTAKLHADPDYMGMIAKNTPVFLPGLINDDIWRTI
jgi:hypothetical protein